MPQLVRVAYLMQQGLATGGSAAAPPSGVGEPMGLLLALTKAS